MDEHGNHRKSHPLVSLKLPEPSSSTPDGTCPICSSPVRHNESDEGTHSYVSDPTFAFREGQRDIVFHLLNELKPAAQILLSLSSGKKKRGRKKLLDDPVFRAILSSVSLLEGLWNSLEKTKKADEASARLLEGRDREVQRR